MSQGIGNIVYNSPPAVPPGTTLLIGANNGVSISSLSPGFVVLGQNVGQAGSPGALLSNREIPLAGFNLNLIGVGATSNLTFKYAAPLSFTPQLVFQNSAGIPVFQIIAGADGPNNSSLYMGLGSGISMTALSQRNLGIGNNTLNNITTGIRNIAIGTFAMSSVGASTAASSNIAIGVDTLDTGPGTCGNFNTMIGTNSADNGSNVGSNNIILGSTNNNSNGLTIVDNNIIIGNSIAVVGISNSIIFTAVGTGPSVLALSNVVVLGLNTHNILIGQAAAGFADNGNRLQISGKLNTGGAAPLTIGAGAMDFGKVVIAASALNAGKYLEISVDGVLVKVCIN